jgi:hypothetical protein
MWLVGTSTIPMVDTATTMVLCGSRLDSLTIIRSGAGNEKTYAALFSWCNT